METFLTPEEYYTTGEAIARPFNMEPDPDGRNQQVAVIMTGQVYREAGLKHSKHPEVEGRLYDQLCQIGKHKLRDEVRRMALNLAISVNDHEFKPTVAWLDNFMRRFCLSKKKMGFHSTAMLVNRSIKKSVAAGSATSIANSVTEDEVLSVLGINGTSTSNGQNNSDCDNSESSSREQTSGAVLENGTNGSVILSETETDIPVVASNASSVSNNKLPSDNLSSKNSVNERDGAASEKNTSSTDVRVKVEPVDMDTDQSVTAKKEKGKSESNAKVKKEKDSSNEEDGENDADGKIEEEETSNSNENETSEEEVSEKSDGRTSNEESEDGENGEDEEDKEEGKDGKKTKQEEDENITYSKKENKYYQKNIDELQKKLKGTVVKCMSCYQQVNHQIRSLVYTHPMLGVFMCKRCRKYYGRGKFCKDEEGYDEYCRLCAEGGDLLCCEKEGCFNGFCKKCIKRTMGRSELQSAEKAKNWACYACDPTPMMELRALHRAILANLKNSEKEDGTLSRKDLKTKSLKTKFEALKMKRQEQSQKVKEPVEPSKKKGSEKAQQKTKENKKNDEGKEDEDSSTVSSPVMMEVINNMSEMMTQCMKNISIIKHKWRKSKYSPEGTDKARHHILKQLEAVCNNFKIMEKDMKDEMEMQGNVASASKKEEENKEEQKDAGKKKGTIKEKGSDEEKEDDKEKQKKADKKMLKDAGKEKEDANGEEKDTEERQEDADEEEQKMSDKEMKDACTEVALKRSNRKSTKDDSVGEEESSQVENMETDEKFDKKKSQKRKDIASSSVTDKIDQEEDSGEKGEEESSKSMEKSRKTDDSKVSDTEISKDNQGLPDLESVVDDLLSDRGGAMDCDLGDAGSFDDTVAMMETSVDNSTDDIGLPDLMQSDKTGDGNKEASKEIGEENEKEAEVDDKEEEDAKKEEKEGNDECADEDEKDAKNKKKDTEEEEKDSREEDKSDNEAPTRRTLRDRKGKTGGLTEAKEESEDDEVSEKKPGRRRTSAVTKKGSENENDDVGGRRSTRRSSRKESDDKEGSEEEEKQSRKGKKEKGKKEETDSDVDNEGDKEKTRRSSRLKKAEEGEKKEGEKEKEAVDEVEGEFEDSLKSKSKKKDESDKQKSPSKKKVGENASDEEGEKTKKRKSSSDNEGEESEKEEEPVKRKRGRPRSKRTSSTKAESEEEEEKEGKTKTKKKQGQSEEEEEKEFKTETKKKRGRPRKKSKEDGEEKDDNEEEEEEEKGEKDSDKKRGPKRRKRRKSKLDKEDEILLGLREDSSEMSEEDTDTEMQRRREEHMDSRADRKIKRGKAAKQEEEEEEKESKKVKKDEEEEKESKTVKKDEEEEEKEHKKVKKDEEEEKESKKINKEEENESKKVMKEEEEDEKVAKKIKKGEEEEEEKEVERKDPAEDSPKSKDKKDKKKNDGDGEENSEKEDESDNEDKCKDDKSTGSPKGKKSKKVENIPQKKDNKNKENEKALSALLASDSDKENDDELEKKKKSKKKDKTSVPDTSDEDKNKDAKTDEEKEGETKKSGASGSESELKKTLKKKKKKPTKSPKKTENERAKAAILDSDSDDQVPKPRSKKKRFRKASSRASARSRALSKLTEEEQEELKERQLEGKCEVVLQKLTKEIKDQLKEEEFIYASDYPHLLHPPIHHGQNDDCDADEEDSDKEFSKLMNYKLNKAWVTGGKGKKSAKSESDEGDEKEEEEKEQEKEEEKEGDDKEKTDKKEGVKKTFKRKKKEGLLDIDIDKEDDDDEEEEEEDSKQKRKKKKEGGMSLNEKMKKQILMSSDEEGDDEDDDDDDVNADINKDGSTEEDKERKKYEARKKKEEEKKKKEMEESDEEYAPRVHKKGYMNLNISTDEEDNDKDGNESEYKEEEEDSQDAQDDEEEEEEEDDSDFEESPRKRRAFQLSSSDSETEKKNKKRKKKASSSSDEDSEEEEKPKSKRKRIRKMSSSSDEDEDDGEDGEKANKDESPTKHKKIRRVIRDEDLMETTKNATQEEEERRKRVAERQKHYNQIFEIDVESDQKELGKLVLDFDPETKAELVSVNEKLVKFLKPHQFKGIKFMWDATIESLEMLHDKPGSGCILAHCMGLGKTLQVIAFCHTLLTNKKANKQIQRVMVCCPVNTVYNWVGEFNNWLKGKMLPFDIVELASAKDLWGRAYRLDDWWREGGVCIMGYDMFRNLSNAKSKRYKGKMKEIFQKTLINPGPDLMVCDEGHVLKNEKTALSVVINQIKTKRRIILTGTPLQNNLKEYHCMIQFVKPNLLGTKKEFMNRFVNPIEQGQCSDAMPRDVRRMKRRAHILHNLLEGCVQRYDYTVLKPFLPPKFEYVISVQLSEIQCKLYRYYLDNLAQGGPKRQGSGLFVDFGALSRVWTHPRVLDLAVRRAMFEDDEEEMADFICDDSTPDSSEDEQPKKKKKQEKKKKKKKDASNGNESENYESEVDAGELEKPGPIPGLTESGKVRVDWWKKVLLDNVGENFEEDGFLDKLEHSGKIILLLDILRECTSIGDKVLVFSQSLLALDMIEDFLQMVSDGELSLPQPEDPLPLPYKKWRKDQDYLRLDGSTTAETRKTLCKVFNSPSNERCRLFLISTRAGGLGINLVAANRVVIFDSSWNPSHDTQSIFRVYRFGQKKPCYIYRFVAQGTMEEKIYSRQVTKMSTALRVVDEHQIKRYFKMEELAQLYEFSPADVNTRETPIVPEDRLLAELLKRQKDWIVDYHEHDSLLENQTSEELSEEERKAAWEDYENEKKGFMVQNQRGSVMSVVGNPTMMSGAGMPSLSLSSFSFEGVVSTIKAQNPNLSQAEMCESVVLATKQIQKIHLNHYQRVQAMVYNLKNPMIAPEQRKLLPFGNHPEMLPMLEQQLRVLEENIQRENQVINHLTQITPQGAETSMANLMAAGLLRGQPTSTGMASATSNYVSRPSTSAAMRTDPAQPQGAKDKNRGSNDVIMLD